MYNTIRLQKFYNWDEKFLKYAENAAIPRMNLRKCLIFPENISQKLKPQSAASVSVY